MKSVASVVCAVALALILFDATPAISGQILVVVNGLKTKIIATSATPSVAGGISVPMTEDYPESGEMVAIPIEGDTVYTIQVSMPNHPPESSAEPKCDVDGDGKTGLLEAVYSLRVAAGIKE